MEKTESNIERNAEQVNHLKT